MLSKFALRSRNFIRFNHSKVVGIDLGTTNSAVAIIQDNKPFIIKDQSNNKTTVPSIVAFSKNNNILIGEKAKNQALINPRHTFFATKRLIGQSLDANFIKKNEKDLSLLPYKVQRSSKVNNIDIVLSDGKVTNPTTIASHILNYLKEQASEFTNSTVKDAVITVPAYFNDSQRQATKDAGKLAGLNVLRIINEPTAAALSFGLNSRNLKDNEKQLIAVYDLGGGTFDISILDIENNVFQVIATNGDTHLGGEDFDNVIVSHLVDIFVEQNSSISKENILQNKEVLQRLKIASEIAKIELTNLDDTIINIPFLYENLHLNYKLTEKKLNKLTYPLIEKTLSIFKKTLRDAKISDYTQLNDILLVGGMTRMKEIRSVIEERFSIKPNTTVNPDESVALGAAIQAGILSGDIKDVLLLDVLPLSLGIETYGGAFSTLIKRNTTLPIKKTEFFSTGVDGQTSVDIKIFQGERALVKDNFLIGDFKLSGIEPMPKGKPQIAVTFDIDVDGIINVTAKEKNSNKETSITVISKNNLSNEEIQMIIKEAQENLERDAMLKQRLDLLNKVDIMLSDSERVFNGLREKLGDNKEFNDIFNELINMKDILKHFKENKDDLNLNVNLLKNDTDALQTKSLKFFKEISKKEKLN